MECRHCTACHREKPLDEMSRAGVDSCGRPKYNSPCKECRRADYARRRVAEGKPMRTPLAVVVKTCQNCGQSFTPKSRKNKNKYCSPKCYWQSKCLLPKACEVCGEPVKSKLASARFCSCRCAGTACSRKAKAQVVARCCEQCGVEYSVRRESRFCSWACFTQFRRSHSTAKQTSDERRRPCEICGTMFLPASQHPQYCCSRECSSIRSARRRTHACALCGTQYTLPPERDRTTYCSHSCAVRARYAARHGLVAPPSFDYVCAQCGTPFRRREIKQQYCSRECYAQSMVCEVDPHVRVKVSFAEWRRVKRQLLQECGSRCTYCGTPITWKWSHMDHVVALARGGLSEVANLVLVCPPCNLSKNQHSLVDWNRPAWFPAGQLRLLP